MAKKAARKTTKKAATKKKAASKKPTKSVAKKKAAPKKTAAKKAAPKKAAPKAAKVEAPVLKKARKTTKPKNVRTKSYTQSEFLENVAAFCGLEKKRDAKVLVEDLNLLVQDSLKKGYKLPLFGLGKLYVRKTKPRIGRNPQTGEPINIPARKRVRFTAAKALKEAVL